MGHSRAGNYHANSLNCTKIKLVQDFMSIPIICKFDEEPIKKEVPIRQHFHHYMSNRDLMASNSHVNSRICPKLKRPRFYGCSSLSAMLMKIQSNRYHHDNIFLSLRGSQGQVTLMPIVETRNKSNLSRTLCLSSLSASLMKINQKWSR